MTESEHTAELIQLLGWSTSIDTVSAVQAALRGSGPPAELTSSSAVCFDSNVFINLGKGARGTEIIDYFGERHVGPIVLPAQVLLELWNNHLRSMQTFTAKLSKQFSDLNKTVEEIEPQYAALRDGAASLSDTFQSDFGHVFDQNTRTDLIALIDMLSVKATFSQIDRRAFTEIAALRKRSKTPPGFEDDGDGDFFVWAEFLHGLLLARAGGSSFDRVLLVTDDTKKDWSTNGSPHPILVAEVKALLGLPFTVMRLGEVRTAVQKALE